jgi:very-short-patch-repair endonuclease
MSSDEAISEPNTEADASSLAPMFEIAVHTVPRISFATHQCDFPVLTSLVVCNKSDTAADDVVLRIEAEPPVFAPRTWAIDRVEGGAEARIRDRRVSLAGGLLSGLTERMRADVTVQLLRGDEVLAREACTIDALARNEWGGATAMPELLAAFVMPNNPAIARLLKDASRALEARGVSGSLDGYQKKSKERAWQLVAAAWAAVGARRLSYAEPPASFETGGQKVRTPSDIEVQGLATCLDTSLLFASAVEAMGLNSVVVFTRGHAFAGAWLQPQSFSTLTVDDVIELRKAVDHKQLLLFETTLVTGATPSTFAKAVDEARRRIAEEREDEFVYAIDIRQARGRGIHPIAEQGEPQHAVDPENVGPPIVETPPDDLGDVDFGVDSDPPPETAAERVEQWKRRLLDLSKRNRLLNLRDSGMAIPIFCPDPAGLKERIAAGRRISIVPPPENLAVAAKPDPQLRLLRTGDDLAEQTARDALDRDQAIANVDAKTLERSIIELFRKARADVEEGGSNTLFLAFGSLRWRPKDETTRSYRAPLILLPVRLQRRSAAAKPYLTKHDDDPVFNLTLVEMLRRDFEIYLPELVEELPADKNGIDVKRIWRVVRERVRDTPGFEVVEELTLSTFSFAKYLMWRDLADRTDALKGSPFVRHLIECPRDPYPGGADFLPLREIDNRIDPAELFAPLNADSSQIVAIHASGDRGDFVLEGPPGTGKSETIGNIIAHNLANGRKVLFVSEKMAALEVVHRRLRKLGLGRFCLELHSSQANKQAVLDQLSAAWDGAGDHTATEWAQKAAALRSVRDRLNRLVHALHTLGPAGISPREAIGRVARWGELHPIALDWGLELERPDRVPTPEAMAAATDCARRIGLAFSQVTPQDQLDFGKVGQDDWSFAWASRVAASARAFTLSLGDLRQARAEFVRRSGLDDDDTGPGTEALAVLAEQLPRCTAGDVGFALGADGKAGLEAIALAAQSLADHGVALRALPAPVAEAALASAPIAVWMQARTDAAARTWLFRGRAQSRLRRQIEAYFSWPASKTTDAALGLLAEAQARAKAVQHALAKLPAGVPTSGVETDPVRLAALAEIGAQVRAAFLAMASARGDLLMMRDRLYRLLSDGRDLLEPGMPIPSAAAAFSKAFSGFQSSLAAFRADAALSDALSLTEAEAVAAAIIERTPRLNVWCTWVARRREAEELGLTSIVVALEQGIVAPETSADAFRTAYCRWAAPLMIDQRPDLRSFSAVSHEALIQSFRQLDNELAKLTADYVHAVLSQAIPPKDAPNTPRGLGVLARELQKKMRHLPVRQLVSQMGDSMLSLTPCLMMSPLSVAQFLPANQSMFDLVVFDEASQITVPDAIGAIARGRKVIVVGDPKQMPPTSFFDRTVTDDGTVDGDTQDLESILDEALAARTPHHRLTGHYRSRHESLIAFSNYTYYDGALVTYPSAVTRDSAVSLRRVEGVYAKGKSRTNPHEAQALVAELVRRLRDPREKGKSIGVVTLNTEQQRLIEDLLDAERRADGELEQHFGGDAAEPVFVKNLETVQGDQRDVILLSIGYGPTEPGAKTMSMNFGPLNRQGGGRRLNVAITRATSEVVVFASFDPDMIDLTRSSARAVQELKHYLEYAQRGPAALGAAVRPMGGTNAYDSDFEMAVAEGLRRKGWDVRTQVGVSKFRVDLGVVHPDANGRFLAGIECDGATYHSSPSARDRDRVRHIILEQLGWRLLRLWSTDWFLDPASCLDRLHSQLQELLRHDRAAFPTNPDAAVIPSAEAAVEPVGAAVEPVGVAAGSRSVEPELIRDASTIAPSMALANPDPDRFYDADYAPTLALLAGPIIGAEGVITMRRLARLVARRHGFQRTGREIVRTVRAAVAPLARITSGPDGEEIIWAPSMEPVATVPFRGLAIGDELRTWAETPYPEKLGFAMAFAHGPDPVRAMADALRLGRLAASTREEFDGLIKRAQRVQL